MGRHITQGIDAVDQPITATAQGPIAANDLVKIDMGGWVQKVMEAYPVSAQNSATGPTAAMGTAALGSNYGYGGANYLLGIKTAQALPDGGYALVYPGNGTTSSTGANLTLYGPNGVARQTVVLSASTTIRTMRVVRAGTDNLLVTWTESTDLRIAVVNYTTGAVVLASTSVGTSVQDEKGQSLATLANGEVVLAYDSGGNMVFKRFNASGVLQGVETQAEATQTPKFITVLPLAAGGFIIRWAKTTATQGNRMARFNAAGVLQGAVVGISSGADAYDGAGTTYYAGAMEGKLIELANGNIVSTDISSATAQGFKVYDSTLTLLLTVSTGTGIATNQDNIQLTAKYGGGFYLCGIGAVGATAYYLREYNNAGQLLRVSTQGFSSGTRIIDRPGNGPVVATTSFIPGTPSSSMTMYSLQANLVIEPGSLVIFNLGSNAISSYWLEPLASGLILSTWCVSSTVGQYHHLAFPGGASVLGVAQNAVALGQQVKVATAGKLTMNQTLTSPAFDRRASTPPGTKGMTLGNNAVLNGING
ncbi:hypothetical protein [Acidovorax sp.]|uniref:hypothetical protein n=1 Tax=Acidovorax sp. TaxID=1872122 RepID=UPI002ACE1572|nr:hypothetical protein [Acidovorax sp.]MDZ7862683.1 hypothetical protein [Acidovorax sp.]